MDNVQLVKICLMITFFLEVTIFGNFVSALSCFTNKKTMDLAMTFSGTLFLSIAMIDVIPQAIGHFDQYLKGKFDSSSFHGKLPLTMIIAVITMLIIMYLDKLVMGHSHDHQYEISFVAGPKKNQDGRSVELDRRPGQLNAGYQQQHENPGTERIEEQALNAEGSSTSINWKPFILQIGMSIHAFFQTLALGLQKNTIGVLSLASAILVHKWAQGLTLGLMYKKEGYGTRMTRIMVCIQGLVNVLGLTVGSILMDQGDFVMALFMSMSAGTFFYISLGEVLQEQLKDFNKWKLLMVLLANAFIAFIVWFQKSEEANAQKVL